MTTTQSGRAAIRDIRDGVPQRPKTRWHNPTDNEQSVIIRDDHGAFRFTVAPGATEELDSIYDRAIQHVDCGKDECHKGAWFCGAGHDGNIVGGLAPLLKRVGKQDRLDPGLDPDVAAKKELEAQLAAGALVAQATDRAMVTAAAKLGETPEAPAKRTAQSGKHTPAAG